MVRPWTVRGRLRPGRTRVSVFHRAVRTITDFYSDEWFEHMVASRKLDTESIWARPLTNPIATAHLRRAGGSDRNSSARACAKSFLQKSKQTTTRTSSTTLTSSWRWPDWRSEDGWEPSNCPILPSGRKPDLRLKRPGIDFTVEVTNRGLDKATIQADAFQSEFFWGVVHI